MAAVFLLTVGTCGALALGFDLIFTRSNPPFSTLERMEALVPEIFFAMYLAPGFMLLHKVLLVKDEDALATYFQSRKLAAVFLTSFLIAVCVAPLVDHFVAVALGFMR